MSAPFKKGDQVCVRPNARGPAGHIRKCAGREGEVESADELECLVRFSTRRGDYALVPHGDLEVKL